jgi:hypothetical protein
MTINTLPSVNLDAFVEVLGVGASNAKTADQLAEELGSAWEKTQYPIRKAASEANAKGIPVVSSPRGFYLAETWDELARYASNLDGRISAMTIRVNNIRKCQPWRSS